MMLFRYMPHPGSAAWNQQAGQGGDDDAFQVHVLTQGLQPGTSRQARVGMMMLFRYMSSPRVRSLEPVGRPGWG